MRAAFVALLAVLVLGTSVESSFAAEAGSEDRLSRRVKRFYVLNYLNRYGEMWEMFSDDLRERLGNDRQDYVKSSRRSGFELYSSRIEDIRLKGDVAAVEVTVQAQLAGMFDVSTKRHRMLWRHERGTWRYAGSIDITHETSEETPVQAADLQPPSRTRAPEVESKELLPPRVRVTPGSSAKPATPAETQVADAERWDLVAVPPPGRSAPGEAPVKAPEPSSSPAEPKDVAATEPVEAPARVAGKGEAPPRWLPPR